MKARTLYGLLVAGLLAALASPALAADKAKPVYPVALLPFQERGEEVKDFGGKVTDVLFANLAADPQLYLVEREDLNKVLEELKLSRTGMVRPDQAVQVGQLTGAKILITGSVIQVDKSVYVVAKMIGTETTRVLGASVKGDVAGELAPIVEELAKDVGKTIAKRADELVAAAVSTEDRIAALKKRLGGKKLPTVRVKVTERHVGGPAPDPAAQTELVLYLTGCGFQVIDSNQSSRLKPELILEGEGLSEFAGRVGELISVKARLEVKAVDPDDGKVVAVDRQTAVVVDVTEQFAGKAALQEAAAQIAERMLPKLAGK